MMPPVYRNKNRKGARNEKETISETGRRIQHGFRTAINSVPMDSVENTALMAGAFTISSNRIPPAFPGFRIAQVSDLHNAEFGKGNNTLLRMLAESKPDIIVITGDLVDSSHTDIGTALVFVKEAAAIAPVYYVTGSHETLLPEYGRLKAGLDEGGVTVLEDQSVQIGRDGETVTLIGLFDPDFTANGDLFGKVPSITGTKLENLLDGETGYTVLLFYRWFKFISNTMNIFNIIWYIRCGFQFFMKITDMIVYSLAKVFIIFLILNNTRNHLISEHATRIKTKQHQYIKLFALDILFRYFNILYTHSNNVNARITLITL